MNRTGQLTIKSSGERDIIITRFFAAPIELVFDAHTKPEMVRKWLLGPDGWSMPVCDIDLTVGGRYRYVWKNDQDGREMGMGGVIKEIERPVKLVQTELFDDAWYPGEALMTTEFIPHDDGTLLSLTCCYESEEARDIVLNSPMESGLKASYDRLESVLQV